MSSGDFPQPFIKKFSDRGYFYIYDVNTNQVIEVEKPTYDIIDYLEDAEVKNHKTSCKNVYKPGEIEKIIEEIRDANKEHGIFSNFKPVQITFGLNTADGVKKIHENGLNQIVIELTRDLKIKPGLILDCLKGKSKIAANSQWLYRADPNFDDGIFDINPVP